MDAIGGDSVFGGTVRFEDWLKRRVGFWISGSVWVLTVTIALLTHWPTLDPFLAPLQPYIFAIVHGLQALLIAGFLIHIVTQARSIRCKHRDPHRLAVNTALERLYSLWCWIWGSWFLLYVLMAITSYFDVPRWHVSIEIQPVVKNYGQAGSLGEEYPGDSTMWAATRQSIVALAKRDTVPLRPVLELNDVMEARLQVWRSGVEAGWAPPQAPMGVLKNFINNAISVLFLAAFFIMMRLPTPRDQLRSPGPLPLLIPILLALTVAEVITLPMAEAGLRHEWPSWISGTLGALALALFLSKLTSSYIRPPMWVIVALFVYASIQPAWPVFDDMWSVRIVLTSVGLLLKVLLFFLVSYLFEQGILVYYFSRIRLRGAPREVGSSRGWTTQGALDRRSSILDLVEGDKPIPDPHS
jgi:hypothetical protein